jgi:hypothetical protein
MAEGFFHREWSEGSDEDWLKMPVRPEDVPHRISPAFLAAEKRSLGDKVYAREYEVQFGLADNSLFPRAEIDAFFGGAIGAVPPSKSPAELADPDPIIASRPFGLRLFDNKPNPAVKPNGASGTVPDIVLGIRTATPDAGRL